MAGICGWIAPSYEHNAERILARMADRLPGGSTRNTPGDSSSLKICVAGKPADFACDAARSVTAAIDGTPHWSDTELAGVAADAGSARALVQAYRTSGTSFLDGLQGAFALALFDAERDMLILAVDRMGVRPLCVGLLPDGIVFASTADSVRAHPAISTQIDAQGLYDYVYFHVVPAPGTIFQGLSKLEPAEQWVWRRNGTQRKLYWMPRFVEQGPVSVPRLERELRDTLRGAVRRCRTDEPTGTFLSGGTDSSALAGILAEDQDERVRSYAIGFEAHGYDEMAYARLAARHFDLDLHEYYVTPQDVADALPKVALAYDEPFGNSSAIPAYFCARMANADGTRRMLAGDGGDELFAGNVRYATQKIFDVYGRLPGWGRRALDRLCAGDADSSPAPLRKLIRYVEQARVTMPARLQTYNYLHRNPPAEIFTAELLERIDPRHPIEMLESVYRRAPGRSLLNRMLYLDWHFTLADNDLRKVNRMCELAGVDVAYPFLDDAVVELANRVPPGKKLKGLAVRHFYKRAMRDFLPREIIRKSKHGFGLPFGEWMLRAPQLEALAGDLLSSLQKRGIVRAEYLDKLREQQRSEHAAYFGDLVWVFVMLEQWFQAHAVNP